MTRMIKPLALFALLVMLSGCAATMTSIRYKDLKVETKVSDPIFLDPVGGKDRTVFIQVRNNTGKALDVGQEVKSLAMANGYKVVLDPAKAHYILQARVMSAGQTDKSALEQNMAAGFGGAVAGGAIGAVLGGSQAAAGAAIGAVAVGAVEAIAGSAVQVIWFSVITDVQLSERTAAPVSEEFSSTIKQGSANTTVKQDASGASNLRHYRTRIISSARKVNLTWEEAYPHLRHGMAKAIAGMI